MKGVEVAKTYLGCNESRDKIKLMNFFLKYSVNKDIAINPETTAWCSAFINACERASGNKGTGSNLARSFVRYGVPVVMEHIQKGDILVFKRGGSSWQGHVTYFWDFDDDGQGLVCLGGNQGDAVSFSYYPRSRLIAIRRSS